MKTDVRKMVLMGMLCAISIVLVSALRLPFPAAPFLEYDPADIPIIIGTFLMGPVCGLIITVIVSILQGIIFSSSSGIIGIIMHIFATGFYVIAIGLVSKIKIRQSRIVAVIIGTLVMTAAMVVWNMIFTPIFMNQPFEVVKGMILPIIVPFNLMKAGINGVLALIISYFVEKIYKK
ncbi:MAG: ECF transporter S component [Clostridia bacterium]|nr:ECF transporter S component [Clostridia bacterium]